LPLLIDRRKLRYRIASFSRRRRNCVSEQNVFVSLTSTGYRIYLLLATVSEQNMSQEVMDVSDP